MNRDSLMQDIVQFCTIIGQNIMYVQGTGGNISWKDGDKMWVKASGTKLSEACERNTFIPVCLKQLQESINKNQFHIAPVVLNKTTHRPSIETLFHAVIPQKIVFHFHEIESLAVLVTDNAYNCIYEKMGSDLSWRIVDYCKPGADLAAIIHDNIRRYGIADVYFLRNHGIIVSADNIPEAKRRLELVVKKLTCRNLHIPQPGIIKVAPPPESYNQYIAVKNQKLQELVFDEFLYNHLRKHWAIFPDLLVFLGSQPHCFSSWECFTKLQADKGQLPELIFIKNKGVYHLTSFSEVKLEQLYAYYLIMIRQAHNTSISTLTSSQVNAIVSWDAEAYRVSLIQS